MQQNDRTANECAILVRTQDPDRFLISLFYTPDVRVPLWALHAFNYEIARTREIVTDTHIGLIRLQWWRDALAALYERNAVADHPVVQGLAEAVWRYNMPRELFDQLIYAREFDLEDQVPGSLEGLCNYADYTHTPLLRMGATIAGDDPDHPAVQPVAMAYALAGLLRAVPHHRAQGRQYIPDGVSAATVREKAQDLLRQAARKDEGRFTRLHRTMAAQYLSKIQRLRDNTDDRRLSVPPLFRGVGLWLAAGR